MRLAAVLALLAGPASAATYAEAPGALLRGLDKVTGAVTDLTLPVGTTIDYGRLKIALSDCRYPADDPASNAAAHLFIRDTAVPTPVFDGWMIAAAPALNAMDHARYDVWVMRCTTS